MQYFKHMSNMRHDVKIKRLIARFGIEGYGLYNLILEAITEKLETESPVPDLQETCEDIATFYNGDISKINETANYMINQGLLELDEVSGHIMCHKIYKFLEASQTRSDKLREMIKIYKNNQKYLPSQMSETVTDKSEEKKRKEKKRIEKDTHTLGVPINRKRYDSLCTTYGQKAVDMYMQKIVDYCDSKGKRYKDYAATAANWIRRDEEQGKVKPIKATQGEVPEWAKE